MNSLACLKSNLPLLREELYQDSRDNKSRPILPFRVTELRRSTKKASLSHVKTYAEAKAERVAAEADNTKKAVKKINSNIEKTTLGDLDVLAGLKSQLEKGE